MTRASAWEHARALLIQRIDAELAAMPEADRSVWNLEFANGDMSELPEILNFIDMTLGVQPLDWVKILDGMEKRGAE